MRDNRKLEVSRIALRRHEKCKIIGLRGILCDSAAISEWGGMAATKSSRKVDYKSNLGLIRY